MAPDESNGPDDPGNPEVAAALELLRRLIAARRMSLGELDDQLGHARGYLSRLLQGRTRLTYDILLKLIRAVDVDPAFFFSTLHPPRRRKGYLPTPPPREPAAGAPPAPSRRPDLAELRALLLQQLRHSLPELEEAPPMTDEDLETRILAAVQEILAEDLPRAPRS